MCSTRNAFGNVGSDAETAVSSSPAPKPPPEEPPQPIPDTPPQEPEEVPVDDPPRRRRDIPLDPPTENPPDAPPESPQRPPLEVALSKHMDSGELHVDLYEEIAGIPQLCDASNKPAEISDGLA